MQAGKRREWEKHRDSWLGTLNLKVERVNLGLGPPAGVAREPQAGGLCTHSRRSIAPRTTHHLEHPEDNPSERHFLRPWHSTCSPGALWPSSGAALRRRCALVCTVPPCESMTWSASDAQRE